MQQDSSNSAESDKAEELNKVLFPHGTEFDPETQKLVFEHYKLLNQNAEQMATRRQAINGFFLSINTFLMAGTGSIFKESFETYVHEHRVMRLMMLAAALCLIGFIIDTNWSRLIGSYGKLLQGQYRIMEELEKHSPVSIVTAQSTLHRKDFLSLSHLEKNIAYTFQIVYVASAILAIFVVVGLPSGVAVHPAH